VTYTRARQPEQKEERRTLLLTTARALLEAGTPLHALSLNALAREAGMTKSNVYRYFESREAVLLELLRDEWFAWFITLSSTWTPPAPGVMPLRHLCNVMAHTLAARPLLCALTSVLPSVLEQNVGEGVVLEFKRTTLTFFSESALFISTVVPDLPLQQAMQLMNDGAVVLTGLYPHAHPADVVRRVMERSPELQVFAHDFEADLARLLFAIALATLHADDVPHAQRGDTSR
jgi:AcrR family transcriptional regulator